MKITQTAIAGPVVLTPTIYRDNRGAFLETWNQRRMAEAGLSLNFVQDNLSISKKNVLRGIHYQVVQPQGKLVRVVAGAVLDIAVDLRRSSPTFGQHVAVELTAENAEAFWIPEGFGHGFLTLTDSVSFAYKVTDYYSQIGERTIRWNDPELALPWPVDAAEVIISDKDSQGAFFRDAEVFA